MTTTGPRGAHLVGRVGLDGAEDVFGRVGALLGGHVNRIPDGETGDRQNWIAWQYPVFTSTPGLEESAPAKLGGYEDDFPQVRLARQGGADELAFGPLGYAKAAAASYEVFRSLKSRGDVPPECRFQVSLPTPLAPTAMFVTLPDQEIVEPVYERRMVEELAEITSSVPAGELAIQWDVAVEFALLEEVWEHRFDDVRQAVIDRLARIGQYVPAGVEVGYHLCYGNKGSKHFKEPADTALMVHIAQGVVDQVDRQVDWVHLPVPIDRADDAYYRPLADLRLAPETELYLGLIHLADGVEGGRERVAAAHRHVSKFGIAGECGFPIRGDDTVAKWLRLHASLAERVCAS